MLLGLSWALAYELVALLGTGAFSGPGLGEAERPSFIYFSFVTLTTVGYGDIVPETQKGRVAATFLMLTGITSLGVVSGVLASAFRLGAAGTTGGSAPPANGAPEDVRTELAVMRGQMAAIEQHIAVLAAPRPAPPSSDDG